MRIYAKLLVLLLTIPCFVFISCSKDDSGEDTNSENINAPQSVTNKSFIWKHNGFKDNTYTFNFDGSTTVHSIVDNTMGAITSNSTYAYAPSNDGNALLTIQYTSSYSIIGRPYKDSYKLEFVLTFYKSNSGVYSALETVNGKTINKAGPFLLGQVGDLIEDEDSSISGSGNCEQRQYIYDRMKQNLTNTENLRDNTESSSIRMSALNLISRIKQDMSKAKTDAQKAGCNLN